MSRAACLKRGAPVLSTPRTARCLAPASRGAHIGVAEPSRSSCGVAAINGVEADLSRDGQPLVQSVTADGASVAAACGRTVATFSRVSQGFSVPTMRSALPSTVTTLGYFGGSLVAGTMHSGVYIWRAPQLCNSIAPPALHLETSSSIISLFAVDNTFIAWCGDRMVKLWEIGRASCRERV